MQRYQLTLDKANILRQRFIDCEYHSWLLAKELRIFTITTWRYKREFEKIRAEYPERLKDFGFYPGGTATTALGNLFSSLFALFFDYHMR